MSKPWEGLEKQIRAVRPEPLSAELQERIVRQLGPETSPKPRPWRRHAAWVAVAAACSVIAAVGVRSWWGHLVDRPGPSDAGSIALESAHTSPKPAAPSSPTRLAGPTPTPLPAAPTIESSAPPGSSVAAEKPNVAKPDSTVVPPGPVRQPQPRESVARAKPVRRAVAKIDFTPAPGRSPAQAWDEYFATHDPEPAAVREAVRGLRKQGQIEQTIALIESALRHGQPQPWMYEAMALAMQAADRPKAQIERVAMSAVEFCQTPADLMYLGVYLTQLGLDRQAIGVFRQLTRNEPLWPEPHMHAMRAAERINDVDALQWSTVGILSQGWTTNQSDVWQTALRVARATLADLRAQHRDREAAGFQAAMDQAMVRDCVVAVYWTGDAEVDLLIEDPTGEVCSMRNCRTTSGGVLCGDVGALNKNVAAGHCQLYVCPKGFSGKYRLLVRRLYGEVITGRATVEVVMHYHAPDAQRLSRKVLVDGRGALIPFELALGRRTERLSQRQLANAAWGQMAIGGQILAQQGGGEGFPEAAMALAMPEGANLTATSVLMPDKRHVRITTTPLFAGITQVVTLNRQTGPVSGGPGIGEGGRGFSGVFGTGID